MVIVETHFYNSRLLAPQEQPLEPGLVISQYPQWSHQLVAGTAALLDFNPLRSMQVWAILWLITGCYLISLRIVFLPDNQLQAGRILFTGLYLAVCAFMGFGLRGHIEDNFFFAHLAGTVLAIAGIIALQHFSWGDTLASLFIVLWGGIVLPNFHLVPAVWFALSGVLILVLRAKHTAPSVLYSLLIGVICLLSWSPQGGSKMMQIANNNGWFLTRFGQLSDHGTWLAGGLCVVLSLFLWALLVLLRQSPLRNLRSRLVPYSGLIAVCILIGLQSALYVFLSQGSVYAIAKYLYLLASEGAVLVATVRWRSMAGADQLLLRHSAWAKIACVILLFCAQGPFIATPDDQTPLMDLRAKLLQARKTFDPQHRAYPQFSNMDFDRNFYLATAIMRIPLDERTFRWVLRGAVGEEAFVWPSQGQIVVPGGGFENGTIAPWMLYGTVRASVTGEQAHDGKFSLLETEGVGTVYIDVAGLDAGAVYNVSAWVYAPPGTNAAPQLLIADPAGKKPAGAGVTKLANEWQRVAASVAATPPGVIRIHLARSGSGTVYWDDVRMSREAQ